MAKIDTELFSIMANDAFGETVVDDNGQLLKLLQQNWSDYINQTAIKDKHHSLQLFLFNFRLVDESLLHNEDFISFFKFIPEEICSYLLKQTYNIINTGDLYANCAFHADDIKANCCNLMQSKQQSQQQVSSTDLLLYPPSQQDKLLAANDHNKIVALREYFTLGLGHHLLEFLLKIDIKLVTSLKNLCNLCYNIFPNGRWHDGDKPKSFLQPISNIYDCVGNFYIYKKIKNCKQEKQQQHQQQEQMQANSCRHNFNLSDESQYLTSESDGQSNQWQPLVQHDALRNEHFVRKLNNLYKSQEHQQQLNLQNSYPYSGKCNNFTHANKKLVSNIWLYVQQLYTNIQQQQPASHYQTEAEKPHHLHYHQFRNMTKSSDEIALMLIRLLYKCTSCPRNAVPPVLDEEHSIHMMALHFALDQLLLQPDIFTVPANTIRIKLELLALIEQCLNNLFLSLFTNMEMSNFHLQFHVIFQKLYQALNANSEHSCLQHAILYMIFNTLYNAITLNISMANLSDGKADLMFTKNFLDETILNTCCNTIGQLVQRAHERNEGKHEQHTNNNERDYGKDPDFGSSEDDLRLLFINIHQTIMRLVLQLQRYQQIRIHKNNFSTASNQQSKPLPYKKIKTYQIHCVSKVPRLSCHLQQLLLNLFHVMPIHLQEEIIVYFVKFGACCCQYNVLLYSKCLNAVHHLPARIQRNVYKFLSHQVLHNMYLHSSYYRQVSTGRQKQHLSRHRFPKYDNSSCAKCLTKFGRQSLFFSDLLQVYCDFHQKLRLSQTNNEVFLLFIKHLKHISHYLDTDLASGVLTKILLPLLHNEKMKLHQFHTADAGDCGQQQHKSSSDNINLLNQCLQALPPYLYDVQLIKTFYTEENIQCLQELLEEPELFRGVCDLIKIGIENINCLGETDVEHDLLSCRFINLQLNSSAQASQLFHSLLGHLKQLDQHRQTSEENQFWLEDTKAFSKLFYSSNNFNVYDILYFVTLQWSLNVELLKTSQYFHSEFCRMYSIRRVDDDCSDTNNSCNPSASALNVGQQRTIADILRLNFNALIAYLLPPLHFPTAQRAKIHKANNEDKHNNLHIASMDAMNISVEAYAYSLDLPVNTIAHEHWNETPKLDWSFLEKFHRSDQKHCLLYDIKHQSIEHKPEEEQQSIECLISKCYSNNPAVYYNSNDFYSDSDETRNRDSNRLQTDFEESNHGHEEGYLISKLVRTLGSLFSREINNTPKSTVYPLKERDKPTNNNADHSLQVYSKFYQFYENNSKGKKLLLKLFAATLSAGIKSYQNEAENKLEEHLQKLKAAILENIDREWSPRCEVHQAYQNLVIQLLRTLLQVAELSNIDNQKTYDTSTGTLSTTRTPPPLDEDAKRGIEVPLLRQMSLTPPSITSSTPDVCHVFNGSKFVHTTKPKGAKVFNDYLSKCTSDLCNGGSDLEASDNELDNFYITANEDYDADVEIAELSEDNDDHEVNSDVGGDTSHSYQISHYRTHVLHEGICRLVIEVLIELSRKCCEDPASGWSDGLVQLLNRLFIIRKQLGSPNFLLKGFTSILQCSDIRLRDLQQAFLELITDLTTSDNLILFFSMLAAKNPPVDILIKHINHIVVNTLKTPQPSAEIQFPMYIQAKESTTSDLNSAAIREFCKLRSHQMKRQINSAITRAPCCMPIGDDKTLYQAAGFTISIWLQIKQTAHTPVKYSSQCSTINDDAYSSRDQFTKTHILSVGSNQVMLSIYITNSCHLHFEISKPTVATSSSTNISTCNYQASSANIVGLCLNTGPNTSNDSVTYSIRKAFKHTNALYTSLTAMQLFPGFGAGRNNYDSTSLELSQHHLLKNKWTHFLFGVQVNADSLCIRTYTDALEQNTVQLKFPNIRAINRNYNAAEMLLLGDGVIGTDYSENDSFMPNRSEVLPTMEGISCRIGVSTVMIFDRCFSESDVICNLTAMGPDFCDLTKCLIGNWKPNAGYLNLTQMHKRHFGNYIEALKLLREAQVLSYSAQHPNHVMNMDMKSKAKDGSSTSATLLNNKFLCYGHLAAKQLASLQSATILSGGLTNLLYLFARVVEISTNSATQAMALNLLLKVALSESRLYTEFLGNDYLTLIGYVIKSNRCTKDCQLLKSIVNNACSQPVINRKGDQLLVNDNTTAIIIHPRLLTFVLQRYSDWHRSGSRNSQVLDMLLTVILSLTRDKHPKRDFNIGQLNAVQLIRKLLNLCKVHVIESPNPIYISPATADSFADVIARFAASPASSMLDEIMKLLLLLHKPSDCYVTDDRSRLYFLITPNLPPQQNSFKLLLPGLSLTATRSPAHNITEQDRKAVRVPSKLLEPSEGDMKCMQRQRRKHSLLPTGKQLQQEFVESMANITTNTTERYNNIFHLLSPEKLRTWRGKYKRVTSRPSHFYRKIHKTQSRSPKAPSGKHKSANKTKQEGSSLNTKTLSGVMPEKLQQTIIKPDVYTTTGVIALQTKLLQLLTDFICLMPDYEIDDVVHHYVKVEFLLVLANNGSCSVRTAVVKLLNRLIDRLYAQDVQMCFKNFYHYHLANQLILHDVDESLFAACLESVTGRLYQPNALHLDWHIENPFALNALLAVACKCTCQVQDPSQAITQTFSEKCFVILKSLFTASMDCGIAMIEANLLQCACKALYNVYASKTISDCRTEAAIVDLLIALGEFSLKSFGHMHLIWDLNNLFAFYQLKQSPTITQSFRSTQAKLLLNWIQMFFANACHTSGDFKVVQLNDCALSLSEIHTRLELLLRHSIQYFTLENVGRHNSNASDNEISLFKFLLSYNAALKQRCNSFIAWGLKPCRPLELRAFVIDVIWQSSRDEFMSSFIADGKVLVKSLLWQNLVDSTDVPIRHLAELCEHFGIKENDLNWNLENELQNMKMHNDQETYKQRIFLEKTIYRYEGLVQNCIESAMSTTRKVAEVQNSERKLLMSHMKDYDDSQAYSKWLDIVRRLTHECAPWHSPHNAKNYWELDETEGPSRIHNRLRRCHLRLDKRFFLPTSDDSDAANAASNSNAGENALDYLIGDYRQQLNIPLNAQILHNFPAKYLPVDGEISGEIIITEQNFYFIATRHCKYFYLNFHNARIVEIWQKRYQQQEMAFEVFFDTSQSLFFVLLNQNDWKLLREVYCDKIIANPDNNKLMAMCQQWRDGQITNWEYLMLLNQMAGRTYNDLMQYPIFPWILANYTGHSLDLNDYESYRNLAKPIAIQNAHNEAHYISNYNYIKDSMTNVSPIILQPYHYSSHYSNSGTVLHFLVRVPPFTSYFLRYQDNNFDIPDRTFHNLNTTWQLASRDSPTDVKELIPEFFCLPEMFENFNRLNFGVRQNGEAVQDVVLPDWCQRDPRLFVLVHRQALESDYIRRHLHNWIDLIFGYKQIGQAAIDAINVFHPATYSIFLDTETLDPIERNAVLTMVKTYGQMPRQLFKTPHAQAKPLANAGQKTKPILVGVQGLQWGVYVGSPQLPPPNIVQIYKLVGAEHLLALNNTNVVYGFAANARVMQGPDTDTYNMISWGYDDRIVRIQPFNSLNSKSQNLFHNNESEITACGCDPNSNQLWFGYKSGCISIYKCTHSDSRQMENKRRQSYVVNSLRSSYNSAVRKITNSSSTPEADIDVLSMSSSSAFYAADSKFSMQHADSGTDVQWVGPTALMGHKAEITCIQLSVEFKAAVTADRDGLAIVWDLNDWSYVSTIPRPSEIHRSPISLLSISPTLGDIVTVHNLYNNQEGKTVTQSADAILPDECFEVTEENLDDFINVSINPNGKSMLRLHSINAHYVKHIVHEDRMSAICCSRVKEGVGVNVIATAIENGIIRLWSSWNLNYITEIVTGAMEIRSITYSMHQHLIVLTADAEIQVWQTEGLAGNAPKFPQIVYK